MIRKIVFYTRVWVTLLAPFVLVLLPADFFDHGEALCLSKRLAGMECPACGLTRGIMHCIHLDFAQAWNYNKLSFIVLILMVPLWIKALYEARGKKLPDIMNKLM